jgi:hypothetical protein
VAEAIEVVVKRVLYISEMSQNCEDDLIVEWCRGGLARRSLNI